jgi:3',5'-cyclic AMP phosphodiesterase CpdA
MYAAFLHLSDLHLSSDKDPLLDRASAIARTLNAQSVELEACFIIITGDVAKKGMESEYAAADKFLHDLTCQITKDIQLSVLEIVLVPGNHDCDFSVPNQARDLLLDRVPEQPDDDLVSLLTAPQNNFFNFARGYLNLTPTGLRRLGYSQTFEFSQKRVAFRCYNTSWLSRLRELPATLSLPLAVLEAPDQADLIVSVFHHPYNWLHPDIAKKFRQHIEQTSDFILTGHEHDGDHYKRTDAGGSHEYFEGGVLQDGELSTDSSFNLVLVDLERQQQQFLKYALRRDHYASDSDTSRWQPFDRSRLLRRRQFPLSDDFARELQDPGAKFNHPRKRCLQLDDIFVPPPMRDMDKYTGQRRPVPPLQGSQVEQRLTEGSRILVTGASRSGKTTLARRLFLQLHERGLVPVLIDASQIRHPELKHVRTCLDDAFRRQYSPDLVEKYRQLAPAQRAVLVDDFEDLELNREGYVATVASLETSCGRVYLFGDDCLFVDKMEVEGGVAAFLGQYEHLRVCPFGYGTREKLVHRWLALGREYEIDEITLDREVRTFGRDIETVIANNLVPSYPFSFWYCFSWPRLRRRWG